MLLPRRPAWRHWLWPVAIAIFLVLLFVVPATRSNNQVTLNYTQFLKDVAGQAGEDGQLATNGSATGNLTREKYTTAVPTQARRELSRPTAKSNVQVTAKTSGTSFCSKVLSWIILLLPFFVLGYLWLRLSKGAAGRMQGAFGVGRSRAKVFDEERPKTTFADVAGYEGAKAEIREVVDFLQHPERYAKAGAMAPRGVLMVGPAGYRKDPAGACGRRRGEGPVLLGHRIELRRDVRRGRRCSSSRSLRSGPKACSRNHLCGRNRRHPRRARRGGAMVVSNDEREQTLNQLLAEMDGFDPTSGYSRPCR